MAFSGSQINKAAFAQQVDLAAIAQSELFDRRPRHAPVRRHLLQRRNINLHVEVAGVCDDRAVLHFLVVLFADHTLVAGNRAEDIAKLGCFVHCHDAVAIHRSFERARRIDLGNDHVRAQAASARRQAASAPAVAGDYERAACEQEIGGAHDAVNS